MSATSTVREASKGTSVRPKTDLTSLWGNQFLNYEPDSQVAENYSKQIEELKDEVRRMLVAADDDHHESRMLHKDTMMNLIDELERLGISYHFEDEIELLVQHFFNENTNYEDESYDLYTIGVHFRIFRQHGYWISSDVFKKFMDESGRNFLKSLESDVRGAVSLYEAAHLRVHEETILEDALAFATANLKSMAISPDISLTLNKQVEHALAQPLHFGVPRLEACKFISVYEDMESRSETLLRFAKIDFNILQMLHKQEMSELTRWWNELDIISKLPYARDRLVECYFWAVGTYYEPQYSRGRIMLAQAYIFTSVLNDTYDASRISVQNLDILIEAIQRWDLNEIYHLSEPVKPLYKALLELYAGFEKEVAKTNEGREYAVDYAKETAKEVARSYHIEAKGFTQGPLPSFTEFIANGIITCTNIIHTTVALLGMGSATQKDFIWLTTRPKILVAGGIMGRLFNDLSSYETEEEVHMATSIDCYMKDHFVTKEEAASRFSEMIENAWKDTNEELCVKQTLLNYPRNVVARILNFTRLVEVSYKHYGDGYTDVATHDVKQHIIMLLVDSIQIAS